MEYKELQLEQLNKTATELYGNPAYLFNADRFIKNFTDLQNAFREYYPNTRIAYSYKTNYIPEICKLVDSLGGYAEVVSSMEEIIARACVSDTSRIIYNGLLPEECMLDILNKGGKVNVESEECLKYVLHKNYADVKIGIRIGDENSRFGFLESDLFEVLGMTIAAKQKVSGIHCHVGGSRSLETWKKKTARMLRIAKDIEKILGYPLEYIDLGGHLYGRMDDDLKKQFGEDIPTFQDYAEAVAKEVMETYKDRKSMPQLILEPGTALIADAVSVLATVQNLKLRGKKHVVTLDVSSFDCGMIADYKDLTIQKLSSSKAGYEGSTVVCGYTCMEEDYINRDYHGALEKGDRILIKNCGAYSISMKGNFIFPSLPMYMVNDCNEIIREIKGEGKTDDAVRRCLIGGKRCVI